MKKVYTIIAFLVIALGGAFFVYYKNEPAVIKEPIPSAQVYPNTTTKSPSVLPAPSKLTTSNYSLPSEVNLAIPFTVQAPHGNWDEVHGEFCEEASVLMAISYVNGWTISSPEIADSKMLEIKSFEESRFGYYKDTTAEETAVIIKDFYNYKNVKVLYEPNIFDIKKALAEGKAVIIPAAGRQLGNPYFTQPGPIYHMLVIKGYTKDGNFITNDPGTRRGENFIYNPDVIMNAIHDWNGGDVEHGRKVIIIVG